MKLRRRLISILKSKNWRFVPFLLPSLAGVSCFVIAPFGDVLVRSMKTMVTDSFCGLVNYQTVFSNEAFLLASKNTLYFDLVCLPLLIGLSLLVAVMLSKSRLVQALKSAYLFPLAVPTATVVLIWKMLFEKNGICNAGLSRFGIEPVDWMGSDWAFVVLIISYIWKNLGYTVLLWLSGILGISESIIEAAKVDGAGEAKIFFSIILPNLKPVFYTITVLSFLNSFKVFREAYLVAGAYPQESIYLLQHLFNNWFTNLEIDKMAAAAVVIAVLLSCFVLLLQKLWDITPDDESSGKRKKIRKRKRGISI